VFALSRRGCQWRTWSGGKLGIGVMAIDVGLDRGLPLGGEAM
jgi:hypothetical protein